MKAGVTGWYGGIVLGLAVVENLKTAMLAPVSTKPWASALVALRTCWVAPALAMDPDSSSTTATWSAVQAATSGGFAAGGGVVRGVDDVATDAPEQLLLLKSSTVSVPPGGAAKTCSLAPAPSGSAARGVGSSRNSWLPWYS